MPEVHRPLGDLPDQSRAIPIDIIDTANERGEVGRACFGGEDRLREWVRNPALAGFTLPKVLWLRNHEPEAYERLILDVLLGDGKEKRSELLVSEGTVIDNIDVPPAGGCVVSVRARLDGGHNVLTFPGFHQLFFYGEFARQLTDFAQLFGLEALQPGWPDPIGHDRGQGEPALHELMDRLLGLGFPSARLARDLLESELFGHEKGAFTGAISARRGRFEMAHGGTLFLDEIGDMPLALQAKMLRFLQERVIERVGGREEISVDVRVICATNQNPQKLITAGAFREDLYYRVAEITIDIPPYREREEGRLILARTLLQKYCKKQGRPIVEKRADAAGHAAVVPGLQLETGDRVAVPGVHPERHHERRHDEAHRQRMVIDDRTPPQTASAQKATSQAGNP